MKCRLLILLLPLMLSATAVGQHHVELCTDWVATVDEQSQQIVLNWRPSATPTAMGYHICSGIPCLDYDTVFGRFDTTYLCADHTPLERHFYRLHVFDTAYDASALTPSFGNIVLQADIPECATEVSASWTPYYGMPDSVGYYQLLVRLEPYDTTYHVYYSTVAGGPLSYSFEIATGVTRVNLKVLAHNTTSTLVSQSNVVSVERQTVDSAAYVDIEQAVFDSLHSAVRLSFLIDTTFSADHYTLWRSVDASPWHVLATGIWQEYTDVDVNPFDSIYCYQLSVQDACGLNEKYSSTACTLIPDPPEPGVAIPNVLIAGDPDNGVFRPATSGLDGTLYELAIYDRKGLLIYQSADQSAAWQPSSATPQGAYTYILRVRYNTGVVKSHVGTVILIK